MLKDVTAKAEAYSSGTFFCTFAENTLFVPLEACSGTFFVVRFCVYERRNWFRPSFSSLSTLPASVVLLIDAGSHHMPTLRSPPIPSKIWLARTQTGGGGLFATCVARLVVLVGGQRC